MALWPWHQDHDLEGVTEFDFVKGGPLHDRRQDLSHWASDRGQTLFRTVHGAALPAAEPASICSSNANTGSRLLSHDLMTELH